MKNNNLYYNNSRYYEDNTKELLCEGFYELSDADWWFKNGMLDREDGPAYVDEKTELFYRKGRYHNSNGPAKIYKESGLKIWYLKGVLVYGNHTNRISDYDLSEAFKRSIIKYELSK
jgi:hypothetical protein